MTTLVSFATQDCIVLGCDSLGTVPKYVVPLEELFANAYDSSGKLKTNANGEPEINNIDDLIKKNLVQAIPYTQVPHVVKLFHLEPANVGVLIAGISAIGDKTLKMLIEEFITEKEKNYLDGNYTVEGTADKLKDFIEVQYNAFYDKVKPELEIIVAGYSKSEWLPEIFKITFNSSGNQVIPKIGKNQFGFEFGGQDDVIRRVVFGYDFQTYMSYVKKQLQLIDDFKKAIQDDINSKNLSYQIPETNSLGVDPRNYFPDLVGSVLDARLCSEQVAIDYVDFLVDLMIKAQQFSGNIPTVGGDIHLAIISKTKGFKWISKEEYRYKNYGVPRHDKK